MSVATASAESHPAWWRLVSPDASALIGIDWEHLRSSPFADAIQEELSGDDGLGFPQLDFLREAREVLISSPALLAAVSGNFPAEKLREEADRKGIRRAVYHDVEMWITPGKETLSIARLSDDLILVGHVKDLQAAIGRNQSDDQAYSPLLARAAHYAPDDFWIVSGHLPDPLASRFVPIEAEAEGFEGSISLQGGLRLSAWLRTSSPEDAADVADSLKETIASLPPVAQGIQVRVDQTSVNLSLGLTPVQFLAALRSSSAAAPVAEVSVKPEPISKPVGPQVIRIYGLDDGPREIVVR